MPNTPMPMPAAARPSTLLVSGEPLTRYGFADGHPWGRDRQGVFLRELAEAGLTDRLLHLPPREADRRELEMFHAAAYLDIVAVKSASGEGFLDAGDTPAFRGVYEAAAYVVGATLEACAAVMAGKVRRAFIPIAGLHHASREHAAGFCVFNDCGVAVEWLRRTHGLTRIAYVDIDAHHGDGVFYGFEDDPGLIFADLHEDGRVLYPGTGARSEIGRGAAAGTKLNIPLAPGADDTAFHAAWLEVEAHLREHRPEFILFQCGGDSLEGDPITHLAFTEEAHAHAATRLCAIAEELGHGRVVGTGGGGYNRRNIARAWTRVVQSFIEAPIA